MVSSERYKLDRGQKTRAGDAGGSESLFFLRPWPGYLRRRLGLATDNFCLCAPKPHRARVMKFQGKPLFVRIAVVVFSLSERQ
jgi:hypothetical protein